MKNQHIVDYLVDNNMMLDQCDTKTRFGVEYVETDGSRQYDVWTLRTLWDEIWKDDITSALLYNY